MPVAAAEKLALPPGVTVWSTSPWVMTGAEPETRVVLVAALDGELVVGVLVVGVLVDVVDGGGATDRQKPVSTGTFESPPGRPRN